MLLRSSSHTLKTCPHSPVHPPSPVKVNVTASAVPTLPITPRGWEAPKLLYNVLLPSLPALSDAGRRSISLQDKEKVQSVAWHGDAVLRYAATRSLSKLTVGNHAVDLRTIRYFCADALSNNVFSYLSLFYGLIDLDTAHSISQKTSADLFEAYIGACDLEYDIYDPSSELTIFLRDLFTEQYWPALSLILDRYTSCGLVAFPTTSLYDLSTVPAISVELDTVWPSHHEPLSSRISGSDASGSTTPTPAPTATLAPVETTAASGRATFPNLMHLATDPVVTSSAPLRASAPSFQPSGREAGVQAKKKSASRPGDKVAAKVQAAADKAKVKEAQQAAVKKVKKSCDGIMTEMGRWHCGHLVAPLDPRHRGKRHRHWREKQNKLHRERLGVA